MTRQLAFDLPVRPALGCGDFFVAPANALAVAALDRTENWPGGKMLLVGPPGAGKTHLAHVWAARTGALVLEAAQTATVDLPDTAALVIEDAAQVAGRPELETALFHLHNHLAQRRGLLLLTATHVVRDWGIALPDLKSRMEATATATLMEPDNELLGAVLVKLFADRQLAVSPGLIRWLLGRMNRSFATARDIVAALDAAALANRRPITRELAAELLDSHGNVTS